MATFLSPLAANILFQKQRYVSNKLIQTWMLYGPNEPEYEEVRRYSLRNNNLLDNNQMNNVIQNLVPHYQNIINNNHIDAIDHYVQRPNTPINTAPLRRLRCIYDIEQFRRHLQTADRGWVKSYPVDQPNDIRLAPLFVLNDRNYDRIAAIENQKLNPHCLCNIAENTAIFTNRDANGIYHDAGNIYHLQAPFCHVDFNYPMTQHLALTNGYTPIAVTDNIHNGFDPLSNFMDPNRANHVAALWNGNPDLTIPPNQHQRGLASYIAWLAHNETKSIPATYATRVNINNFQPYYTDYKNIQLNWSPDMITRYHEWSNGTFCIIPSNCQAGTSWCAQPHNLDKVRMLVNPTPNSYAEVVQANTNHINNQMNLPQINNELTNTTAAAGLVLSNGNYNAQSGRNCYGNMDVGDAFIHHHHEVLRSTYNDPVLCPELGHSCVMQTILNSDLRAVAPQTLDGTNLPGHERIIRWRLGVPTYATHHIIRGHDTAPFTGATWILFGKCYRPCRTKVQRIVLDLPHGAQL